MFATMRRTRRSATMKNELGQSVDHLKRAATIAAQETSATVGPKLNAARDRVQPAATKAKGAASSSWESAVATITPIVAAADKQRATAKATRKQARADRRFVKRTAAKLERRANRKIARRQSRSTGGRLVSLALAGTAVGAGAAYLMRRRKAAQWDEYDPNAPTGSSTTVGGAEDAAFEPTDPSTVRTEPGAVIGDTADQIPPAPSEAAVTPLSGKKKG